MTALYRHILPKQDSVTPPAPPTPPTPEKEPAAKRQTTSLACQRCRSKKIKCDGARPTCNSCLSKKAECQFNDDPETTPHASLVREYRRLEEDYKELLELYGMMRERPESDASIIFQRLRAGDDVRSVLSLVKEGDLVTGLRKPLHTHHGQSYQAKGVKQVVEYPGKTVAESKSCVGDISKAEDCVGTPAPAHNFQGD